MKRLWRAGYPRRMLVSLLILTLFVAGPLSALAEEGGVSIAYVSNPSEQDRLHMRSEADSKSDSLGRYFNGTIVEVLGAVADGYVPVRVGELEGYMRADYLSDEPVDYDPGQWLTVDVGTRDARLHLRISTEENAFSLGQYNNGTAAFVINDDGDFYQVRAVDQEGYMNKNFLQVDGEIGKPVYVTLSDGVLEENNVVLRAFPSEIAPSLGIYPEGTTVRILAITSVWYYVEITGANLTAFDRQKGFMLSNAMRVNADSAGVNSGRGTFAVVHQTNERDKLVLRAGPAWSTENIGTFFNATQVMVLDNVKASEPFPTWTHVQVSELEGYMLGEHLSLIGSGEAAVQAADDSTPQSGNLAETESPEETGEANTEGEEDAGGDAGAEDMGNAST